MTGDDRTAKRITRRGFFPAAARWGVLAALGALVATLSLGRRKHGNAAEGEKCIHRGICRGCRAFAECGLPQALSAKRAGVKIP